MKRTLFDFNFKKNSESDRQNNDNRNEEPNNDVVEPNVDLVEGPSMAKKPKAKYFQDTWLTKWPWVINSDKGMQCRLCIKHKKDNSFTKDFNQDVFLLKTPGGGGYGRPADRKRKSSAAQSHDTKIPALSSHVGRGSVFEYKRAQESA